MNQDQERQSETSPDPEKRAFTGGADVPPEQPDQPAEGNQELLRSGEEADDAPEDEADRAKSHGHYGNLPGYGG